MACAGFRSLVFRIPSPQVYVVFMETDISKFLVAEIIKTPNMALSGQETMSEATEM